MHLAQDNFIKTNAAKRIVNDYYGSSRLDADGVQVVSCLLDKRSEADLSEVLRADLFRIRQNLQDETYISTFKKLESRKKGTKTP